MRSAGRQRWRSARCRDALAARLPAARDYYLANYCPARGWGGALSFSLGLAQTLQAHQRSTLILGRGSPLASDVGASRLNIPCRLGPLSWRLPAWLAPRELARGLAHLPPPAGAVVATSPFWVLAARRAWPQARIVFKVPCLLSHCQPFLWDAGRPASLWARADFAGLRRNERIALEVADLVVVPTRQSEDEVRAFAPPAAGRLLQCHYGVRDLEIGPELRQAQRADLGLSEHNIAVLLAGPCNRNKGFDLAIRALPHTPSNVQLYLVGDGPRSSAWRKLAHELRVANRVHLVGAKRHMEPWYAAADCVASTSHYDTAPNVIREGMSAGRAVLVPRHDPPAVYSGLAEVIEEHGGGFVYDRGDPRTLAEVFTRLATVPELVASMGRQASCVARALFRWDAILHALGVVSGEESAEPAVGHVACPPRAACLPT